MVATPIMMVVESWYFPESDVLAETDQQTGNTDRPTQSSDLWPAKTQSKVTIPHKQWRLSALPCSTLL